LPFFSNYCNANVLLAKLDKNNGKLLSYHFENNDLNALSGLVFDKNNNIYIKTNGILDSTIYGYHISLNHPYLPGQPRVNLHKLNTNYNTIWATSKDSLVSYFNNNPYATAYTPSDGYFYNNIAINSKNMFAVENIGKFTLWTNNNRKYRSSVYSRFCSTFCILKINSATGVFEAIDVAPLPGDTVPLSSIDFQTSQQIVCNERGELYICGTNTSPIVIGNDTIPHNNLSTFRGRLTMLRYGLPCGTNLSYDPPYNPNNLNAAGVNTNTIHLQWQDQSSIEWGFRIYRSNAYNGTYTLVDSVASNTTNYTDDFLPTNTWYWYKICAFNNEGCSYDSNIDSANTFIVNTHFIEPVTSRLKAQPNPYSGSTTITINADKEEGILLQIFDVNGIVLLQEKLTNTTKAICNITTTTKT